MEQLLFMQTLLDWNVLKLLISLAVPTYRKKYKEENNTLPRIPLLDTIQR